MPPASTICFGTFRLDLAQERLWNGADPVTLRPKTWQVLRHLALNPDRLVTKDELLDAVWKDVAVEEKAVNTCIGEIRAALGDSSRRPRFVETVQRRGFRFLAPPAAEAPANEAAAGQPGFVGRSKELALLESRLEASDASLTVVRGAAGIGKSRLVAETLQRLHQRGELRVLTGQCIEDGGLPYLPWVEMIHQQLRTGPSLQLGPAAAELERLIPGLYGSFEATSSPGSDPELARIRLFEALAAFFALSCAHERTVLVVEDLQWIDAASLRALQALLPRLAAAGTSVVATLRDESAEASAPVRTALDALRRRGLVVEVPLRGLDEAETRTLVTGLAGPRTPADVVERIAEQSEGSPFFAEEILRQYAAVAGSADGGAPPATGDVLLPQNVLDVLERRLRGLSPTALAVAEVVAVCGRDCDEPLLELVLDVQPGGAADAVGETIDRDVLREHPSRPGRYRFVHALLSVAIRQRMAAPRRRSLHARLAEAVAATTAHAGIRATEVARHLARAVPNVPAGRAIDALVDAAEHAARSLAYEDAIEHSARALDLARTAGAGSGRSLCELAVLHAEALQKTGDAETVAAAFRQAAAVALSANEPRWLARASLGMATIWDFEAPDIQGWLEHALELLDGSEPALRARLLARLGVVLYPQPGTRARCEALSSEAVAVARSVDDPVLLAQTLTDWLAAQWYLDNLSAQETTSDELIEVARTSGDSALLATAHGWRVVIALCKGEIDRAEAHSASFRALAEELAQPLYLWCSLYLAATLALLRGNLAAGEQLASEAFGHGRLANPAPATIVYFTQMVSIRREQDRIDELLPLLEQNPARMSADAIAWNLPHFYLEADRRADGAAAFARALALGLDAMPGENSRNRRLLTLGGMSLACAALGCREEAARLYEIVQPESARWAVSGFGAVNYGMLENAAGALATCLEEYEAAAGHFERAIAEYRAKGIPIPLARACLLYAEMLLRRGLPGDDRRAAALVEDASALASEFGLTRVRVLIERLTGSKAA